MRKSIFAVVLIAIMLLFVGCTTSFSVNQERNDNEGLKKGANIAITTPEDGYYYSTTYYGSGLSVSRIIKDNIRQYTNSCEIVSQKNINDFSSEELNSFDYIIVPTIFHWEDRATAWSAKPDRIEVGIKIYNSNCELISDSVLTGRSAILTFAFDEPSIVFDRAFTEFVQTLFY